MIGDFIKTSRRVRREAALERPYEIELLSQQGFRMQVGFRRRGGQNADIDITKEDGLAKLEAMPASTHRRRVFWKAGNQLSGKDVSHKRLDPFTTPEIMPSHPLTYCVSRLPRLPRLRSVCENA